MADNRASRPTVHARAAAPLLVLVTAALLSGGCQAPPVLTVSSPNGGIEVSIELVDGTPTYRVTREGTDVILPSRLGFDLADGVSLADGFELASSETTTVDETWTQVWGEKAEIRDHHNELRFSLRQTASPSHRMDVVFRVFDDGVGFRYEIPEQEGLDDIVIVDEATEFALAGDPMGWWIPAYEENRYEYLYTESTVSELAGLHPTGVHTPFTMRTDDGLYLSIHEAALVDFSSMTLRNSRPTTLKADLVPAFDQTRVRTTAPMRSPWRTIQIADEAGDLITSYLILNLNESNQLEDTSWIAPGKYVGIWWEMHIGLSTWGSGARHGAKTENAKRYIDFASEHGFDHVLVEGWNVGWDGNWPDHGWLFSFTSDYSDFDLEEVAQYAQERGVRLIGHHETAAAIANYESQLEDAFALYASLGVDAVKTGYVGWGQGIEVASDTGEVLGLEWHHGQFMVLHHQHVADLAAQHQIMLVVHEPIKDTGLRRTYPNLMTREGARGQEYNAWDTEGGNPPDHVVNLVFTRMLSGPMDYTPGIVDLLLPDGHRVNHTLAKELALYVVLYSPFQMAADLPENYEGQPSFQFIEDVPTDWNDTRVLTAEIGDHVTIVRQDRNSEDWYLGSITDENPRRLEVSLDFLGADHDWVAEIYRDGSDADWDSNPLAIDIEHVLVDSHTTLTLDLAPGGGTAIRFRPAGAGDVDLAHYPG